MNMRTSGVEKLQIICLAPDVPENFNNVKNIFYKNLINTSIKMTMSHKPLTCSFALLDSLATAAAINTHTATYQGLEIQSYMFLLILE